MEIKCIAISCVKNEADIIEAFVRQTLKYCQTLLILDHGSVDATPHILQALQREGLSLHVVRDNTLGHLQVHHIKILLDKAVFELEADWIFCLDADEFISGPLTSVLPEGCPNQQTPYIKIDTRTYYTQSDDPIDQLNPVIRMTYRNKKEHLRMNKIILPSPMAREPSGLMWLH